MADRVATQNGNWNDTATWGGAAVPTISETVHLLTFHVTANVVSSCTWLTGGTSSELILTKNDFTASSTITLDEIAVTTAPDMAGVTLAASLVDIGTNGSLTLSDDLAIVGNLKLGGGTLDMNSKDMTVNGNVVWSAGTLSNRGTLTQSTGQLNWSSASQTFDYGIAAGATVTLVISATSYAKSFTSGSNSSLESPTGKRFTVFLPTGSGWWVQGGDVSVNVLIFQANMAPGGPIVLLGNNLHFQSGSITTVTMDGEIDIGGGDLTIDGSIAGRRQIVEMGSYSLTCASAVIGNLGNAGDGELDLGSGTHSIGSISGGHLDNTDNTLALGTCTILNMTTGIVGAKIDTVTATVAHLYGDGTSTITDVTLASGTIICHNFNKTGSTGNSGDIIFVSGVPGAIVPSGILQHTRHQNRRRSRRMA